MIDNHPSLNGFSHTIWNPFIVVGEPQKTERSYQSGEPSVWALLSAPSQPVPLTVAGALNTQYR
jgi:hypothetical protein